jgi:preprotein translocase subunit SecA
MGKTLINEQFSELISLTDNDFKMRIIDQFNNSRDERTKLLGENQSKEIEKRILLQSIDMNWKSHIQYLEQLRQVVGLRSYGQRDPLIEYKREAFDLFSNLLEKLKFDYITILMNLKVVEQPKEEIKDNVKKNNPNIVKKKIGRNEPCFCGSGKKFKHCCGAL